MGVDDADAPFEVDRHQQLRQQEHGDDERSEHGLGGVARAERRWVARGAIGGTLGDTHGRRGRPT
jgi:hypothetical protein